MPLTVGSAASGKFFDLIQVHGLAPTRCGTTGAFPQRRHPKPMFTLLVPCLWWQRQGSLQTFFLKTVCLPQSRAGLGS